MKCHLSWGTYSAPEKALTKFTIATILQELKYKTDSGNNILSSSSIFMPSTRRQKAKARRPNMIGSLSLEQKDTESGTSTNNQENSEQRSGLKHNEQKGLWVCILSGDTGDLSLYNIHQ